jgi:hypothetical protein
MRFVPADGSSILRLRHWLCHRLSFRECRLSFTRGQSAYDVKLHEVATPDEHRIRAHVVEWLGQLWPVVFALLYVALPYCAYRSVCHWTGSATAGWVGAILTIPIAVFVYVRLFEWLKHGTRR